MRKAVSKTAPVAVTPKVRCAVYTRKSTDEGLDMEFNSLDAQRESCEAYITSQKSEGWFLVADRYDDGGFSGGSLERPALKRLMSDIMAGKINVVVVYKIDRLTRSLMDFGKLVEVFEQHGVTFVSVTQSFNTTTSMGRLTLNILLSFSQFERELSAERIRDKVAASRKRGMWMGGFPPFGYDVANRRLVVNEQEATIVRRIFQRFVEIGSGTKLVEELNRAGVRTKRWTAQSSGVLHEGRPFDKGVLYRLLNNRVYLGDAVHKGVAYPGEHLPLVEQRAWDKVHAILEQDSRQRAQVTRVETPALLKGLIRCQHCDRAMTTSTTQNRNGRQYLYYLCMHASKNSHADCPTPMVSAGEVERVVLERIRRLFRTPELVARTWNQSKGIAEREIVRALRQIDPVWEELFPREQARIVQLLVSRVVVGGEELEIHLHREGLAHLIDELRNEVAA